jgi:hypothetical protein
MKPTGRFTFHVRDRNGLLVAEQSFPNGGTIVGMNDMLNCYFAGGPQRLTWYLGLIDVAGFSGVSASDTMAAHAGWTENTAYTGSRQQWIPIPPAGGLMMNGSPVEFTMLTPSTIRGAFIVSDVTKGGSAGILYATGLGPQPQQISAGQILSVSYSPIMQLGN